VSGPPGRGRADGWAPRSSGEVAAVELDGETVLYHERLGSAHVLNPTASVVWARLDGVTTLATLASVLSEAYGVDGARMRDDVIGIVDELGRQGLLDGVEADPAVVEAHQLRPAEDEAPGSGPRPAAAPATGGTEDAAERSEGTGGSHVRYLPEPPDD
jgi:PqqD family protein of HPr-rel-A system